MSNIRMVKYSLRTISQRNDILRRARILNDLVFNTVKLHSVKMETYDPLIGQWLEAKNGGNVEKIPTRHFLCDLVL